MTDIILDVCDLTKHFSVATNFWSTSQSLIKAVDKVSFSVRRGETLGLVGETGCGKSTVARTVVGLYKPTSGKVLFNGVNIHQALDTSNSATIHRKLQMIFQDPYSSLNPRMTVGEIIGEPLDIHNIVYRKERIERIHSLLRQVGLSPDSINRFPHEFSGGQRQRIGIARALAVEPEFIVCDEPISALDVSIQAQIVNLLQELQTLLGLSYLFIAHNLAMVKYLSHRIAVMYLGSLIELAPSETLFSNPQHPYSQALISAIPIPDPVIEKNRQNILLEGELPSPLKPPAGCKFHTRCRYAKPVCLAASPPLLAVSDNHYVACHLWPQY